MADKRPPPDTDLQSYFPTRPPKDTPKGSLEWMYWEHVEELRVYLQEARMDRGHGAVTAQQREILAGQEKYHAARAARLAAEEAAKSRGDVVGRIVDAWERMPAGQRDEVLAQMQARQAARG